MSQPQTRLEKHKKKKSPLRRFFKYVLVVVFIGVLGGAGYAGFLGWKVKSTAEKTYQGLSRDKSSLREEKVTLGENPVTILLLGVEDYPGSPGHSDSIMLLTINPKTKETAILSIPRDTRAFLPIVQREDKITHAYAFGKKGHKEEATIDAVEHLLDVPIDYYITTNFLGFKKAVDDLGGIDVNVPFDFQQHAMKEIGGGTLTFKKGEMHLNGKEALTFAQMRKKDPKGDFGRQERQQQVIKALADKALSITSLTKANDLLETVGDNVKTNISLREMFAIRNFYKTIQNNDFERWTLKKGKDAMINGIYYYQPNMDEIHEYTRKINKILERNDTQMTDNHPENQTTTEQAQQ
ncbi:LCP family protein [Fictibacillus sp. Mic-4]|uniref:LCP family protein n=1 Tax=Fictibacillus sp. Mic-4 TaxID=3132826 RepID=UPI003CF1099A